jgi:hypothetical protein
MNIEFELYRRSTSGLFYYFSLARSIRFYFSSFRFRISLNYIYTNVRYQVFQLLSDGRTAIQRNLFFLFTLDFYLGSFFVLRCLLDSGDSLFLDQEHYQQSTTYNNNVLEVQ